jgi:hypothetical protein
VISWDDQDLAWDEGDLAGKPALASLCVVSLSVKMEHIP